MFLTETASIADVVLPIANAYEKSGTCTNTCGDVQMLKKAGEFAGVRNDFECIVRIADRMGYDVHWLVPFGGGGTRADMGQTRGAQSGEADRHAVWLSEHNLEPKMSPFDPTAMLDEIQRLVPGYDISRLGLLSGHDEHTQLVQITGATGLGQPDHEVYQKHIDSSRRQVEPGKIHFGNHGFMDHAQSGLGQPLGEHCPGDQSGEHEYRIGEAIGGNLGDVPKNERKNHHRGERLDDRPCASKGTLLVPDRDVAHGQFPE